MRDEQLADCLDDAIAARGHDVTLTAAGDTPPDDGPAGLVSVGPTPVAVGRYRILARVAAGGMGTVYRAFDPTLGREVALKIPHLDPNHPRFEELVEQFVREARLAAAIDHPNVCAVYDAGRDGATAYVVMALVEGGTLSDLLKSRGRFDDPAAAAALTRQVADGLAAAHRRRIVHRDIKPGNILIRATDGHPVLTDFGLARVVEAGTAATRPGVIAGTLAYMAPEQAAGDAARIGPASDVYGLGAVLFQLVTGRLAHNGDVPTLLHRLRTADAPAPATFRPDLDPQLDAVIRRAMARNPADRYAAADEFAAALRPFGAGYDHQLTVTYAAVPRRPSRRWALGAGAVGAVAAAGGAWAAFFRPHAAAALDGELVVRVSTDPEAADPTGRPKAAVAVDEASREALPVRNIDLVHVEVRLTRPAFAYVLWFPAEGGPPTPLFPWDPHPTKGFAVPPRQEAVTEVFSPTDRGRGWPVVGPSGLETAVLLARSTPLADGEMDDLRAMIGVLPATPLGPDVRECAWLWRDAARGDDGWTSRGTLRGISTAESRTLVDEPVIALLKRLRPLFEVVKAVRFSHVGDGFGTRPAPQEQP